MIEQDGLPGAYTLKNFGVREKLMKKKLLSLLLVLIMALSLLPTAVFAQVDPETCRHSWGGRFASVEGGHKELCALCNSPFGELGEHRWDEHKICVFCREPSNEHQHVLAGYCAISAEKHQATCLWCVQTFGTELDHVWDEHNICKLCRAKGAAHVCETGSYQQDQNGHIAHCRWCYDSIGNVEKHTYDNTTDYKCTVCGGIDFSRHVCTPGTEFGFAEGGHQAYCKVCGKLCGDVQKHEYNEHYICDVCNYVDTDRHEHRFDGLYKVARGVVEGEKPGHYEVCSTCHRIISDVQPHNFVRECCTYCGAASEEHTHAYRDIYDDNVIESFCTICNHYNPAGYKTVTHKYKDGVCEDCGYLDPTLVPTSIKLTVNANKQMVISLTFAGGRTMDLTVIDFEAAAGDAGYSFGNFFTEEGVILSTKYALVSDYSNPNHYSVAYDGLSAQEIISNNIDCGNWWNILYYAGSKGIALPSVRFADGVWQVTGTGFDGKPSSMTLTALEADKLFGHIWVYVEGLAPTCGTAGIAAHYRCTACGLCVGENEYADARAESEFIIPATGIHDYDESGKCKECGFANPLAGVKEDDLKTDAKNDKIITDGSGLTLKTEDPVTEDDLTYIKDLVKSSAIRISVDDTVVPTIDQKKDGGLQSLNDTVKTLGEDSQTAKELAQVASTLEKALKDTAKKNVRIESVLDVSVDLIGDAVSIAQIIELPKPITVTAPISDELYAALQGKVVVILRSHTDASGNVAVDELPATLGGEKGSRYVSFETDKASTFALMSYEKVGVPGTSGEPAVKTGDAGITLWLIALPVTALAAAVVIGKRKSEAK